MSDCIQKVNKTGGESMSQPTVGLFSKKTFTRIRIRFFSIVECDGDCYIPYQNFVDFQGKPIYILHIFYVSMIDPITLFNAEKIF